METRVHRKSCLSFIRRDATLRDVAVSRMLRQFRLYMLVGGMPQAASVYLESNNLRIVDERKREIIDLYENDLDMADPSGTLSIL